LEKRILSFMIVALLALTLAPPLLFNHYYQVAQAQATPLSIAVGVPVNLTLTAIVEPNDTIAPHLYVWYFNGVNNYVVIPLTVYGWSGITIQEWLYPFHPKANNAYSKFSMIGDYGTDYPSVFWVTNNRYDYTSLGLLFVTRKPDGARGYYGFSIFAYRNTWVNTAWRFRLSDRAFVGYINGGRVYSATIPSTEYTVLEWNPDTATYPSRYKQFVLGANVSGGDNMKLMQYQLLIYTRDLSDSDIAWNYNYPDNPIRNGLVLWLQAHPAYIKDIDNDGRLEWIDLSGYGNHGKIYGATLQQIVLNQKRTLSPERIQTPAR
jgi:hypothetical protein